MALLDSVGNLTVDQALLLALPFFVAAVALAGDWWRRQHGRAVGGTHR